jgi:hypothetical protein
MTTADAGHWADVSVTEIRRTDDENVSRRKYVMTSQERGSERRASYPVATADLAAAARQRIHPGR